MRRLNDRLAALEAARWARLTPLERSYELIERGVPVDDWPDSELDAFCDAECQHLKCLSEAQVEELATLDPDAAERRYQEMTGQPWPA